MPKHTCLTCPFFNAYDSSSPTDGDCRKEPPKLSSIGVPTHPRVTFDWVACGAHPQVMADAFIPMGAQMGEAIITIYETILPRIVKMALDAGDKMEAETARREKERPF